MIFPSFMLRLQTFSLASISQHFTSNTARGDKRSPKNGLHENSNQEQ